ncbi:MAG TPA: ABC transporter ATP-binding protein [bacterium]|nr:ABC transporter ATP-binding protein [bacterium]HPO10168.1 ABC transporter ATP-binding protein [bacterium]HQO35143.1 ABC transporter ATP-binding protein [bacterium]HQQ00700.1 ABC transporter ATP-binding protein [bacterium]
MILIEKVSKIFRVGRNEVHAIQNVNLHVLQGEFLVIRGPSGSGKSTLLLTIGGMMRPTTGRITVNNEELSKMNEPERAQFRAKNIGFVFQMFHLLPYLSVLENVLLASGFQRDSESRERARELLKNLGLSHRESHRPSELSAGEKQRTAIARALMNRPSILLADEPTGNLDPENAEEVIRHLHEFQQNGGTVIVVTHGHSADQYANQIVFLRGGEIVENPS